MKYSPTKQVLLVFTILTASIVFHACGGAESQNFVGRWTYESGSAITIGCPGQPAQMLDLATALPNGQPGYFTFSTDSGDTLHEIDARGCHYDWSVVGNSARANADQSCANFPDGHGGSLTVHMTDGTKTTADGQHMTIAVDFTAGPTGACSIGVRGTAIRSASSSM